LVGKINGNLARFTSGAVVGVDLPGDPLQNKNFAQNPVNEIANVYKNSNQIFYFARVAKRRESVE
jgi:hypothetical protein